MNDDLIPKALVFDHLFSEHDIWLTTNEFYGKTLDELKALDPCEVKP